MLANTSVKPEEIRVLGRCVLDATIAVVHKTWLDNPSMKCHLKRGNGQRRIQVPAERPFDRFTAAELDHVVPQSSEPAIQNGSPSSSLRDDRYPGILDDLSMHTASNLRFSQIIT